MGTGIDVGVGVGLNVGLRAEACTTKSSKQRNTEFGGVEYLGAGLLSYTGSIVMGVE